MIEQQPNYDYQNNEYAKLASKEDNFLQWFLNTKKDIDTLKFMWRGFEEDNKGLWYKPKDFESKKIMNEQGIHWAVSVLNGYLSRSYQYTNLDQEHMNFLMRKAYRVVYWGLVTQYRQFELSKINVKTTANQILSQTHVILLSARGNGLRDFLTKTHSVQESIVRNANDQRGFFSGFTNLFKRNNQEQ